MKKIVSGLCVVVIAMIALVSGSTIAYAGTYEEEADLVFRKAMEEILAEESITTEVIKVTKEPVFDLSLQQLGYIYIMKYDGKEGFSMVINTEGTFEVAEFYMEADSPFENYEGQYVYPSLMFYMVFSDGEFTETEYGNVLNTEQVAKMQEKSFVSRAGAISTGFETIYYTNKTVNKFELTKRHPAYYPTGSVVSNACVPAAGASVIGFWTRFYPDLMPGFTPGSIQFGQYLYREWAKEADMLVEDLFYKMGTNGTAPGTTIDEFKKGMNSYIKGKGRNITYTSSIINGNFNYAFTKQKLEAGLPLILFIDCFRVDEFWDSPGEMALNYMIANACHAMAGFGYNETTYTLTNGSTRTDTYIQVSTGLGSKTKGYYNINFNTTIDECYAISIF